MSYTELSIINKAGGKIGGFGDQLGGDAFLPDLNGTDKVTLWATTVYPQVRLKVIQHLAKLKCPFRETVKFAELDINLTEDDGEDSHIISDISVGAAPTYAITVTTKAAHGLSTGDTLVLLEIDGDGNISGLNSTTYTITVVDTTSFTLDDTIGSSAYDYTENSGYWSFAPEIGPYEYAYALPSDCKAVVRQLDQYYSGEEDTRTEYQFEVILNRDDDGLIIITNDLCNRDGDGIFVEYVIDQDDASLFCEEFVECIATLLAAELCPVVGRDLKTRQTMLLEYENRAVPDAKKYNMAQVNKSAKKVPNYLGGRSKVIPTI